MKQKDSNHNRFKSVAQAGSSGSEPLNSMEMATLEAPYSIWALAGYGHASMIVDILERVEPAKLARILSASGTIEGLIENGEADRTFALLDRLSADDKVRALTAPLAIGALLRASEEQVNWQIAGLPAGLKARLLSSDGIANALCMNGRGTEVLSAIWHEMTPNEQRKALTAEGTMRGLAHAGLAPKVKSLLTAWKEKTGAEFPQSKEMQEIFRAHGLALKTIRGIERFKPPGRFSI